MIEIKKCKGNKLEKNICDYTIVDIETTGFSPTNNKIIEIAAIKVQDSKVIDTFQKLVNPNEKVTYFTTKLTGITNDMLKTADNIESVVKEFYDFVGNSIIIGHNVNFDINFLYHNLYSSHGKHLSNDYIDTMYIGKKVVPGLPSYKLESLTNYFNISYNGAHRALNDCMFTYECYEKMKIML